MCGFAGIIDFNGLRGDAESRRRLLGAMGDQLALRGPDDEQYYDDGILSFVFRRLAIVDVAGGRQPIWNEDRTVFAAVNGEIYNHADLRHGLRANHVLASHSDCEVIVHLYEDQGPAMLDRLNGMFAMAVWDTRERTLFLARDRMGIKPLFYTRVGNALLFASELKALLAHTDCSRTFDWAQLGPEQELSLIPPTHIRGIHHLPGGHCMTLKPAAGESPRSWWNIAEHFHEAETAPGADPAELALGYGELLRDSVHKRLMSDVPVGLFLSGGIDSSLLAALAAGKQPGMHCFTVVEDTTVEVGDVEQARQVCEHLGLEYHPVRFDHRTLLEEINFDLASLEYLVWAVESPKVSQECWIKHELHRYAKTVVPDLKVMLLGQGADEYAGGYSFSLGVENKDWNDYHNSLLQSEARMHVRAQGVPREFRTLLAARRQLGQLGPREAAFRRQMAWRTKVMQRYNLWIEDRVAAAQGVENRVPFLDHRLVEFLAAVPVSLHEKMFWDKSICREQLESLLPSYPAAKRKVQFLLSGTEVSYWKLRARTLRRLMPEFRDRYLGRPDSLFSGSAINQLYRHALRDGSINQKSAKLLFKCMVIAVFERTVRNLASGAIPPVLRPPSPLREQHMKMGSTT